MIGAAVMVARIATGEIEDRKTESTLAVEASEPKPSKCGPYKKRVAA